MALVSPRLEKALCVSFLRAENPALPFECPIQNEARGLQTKECLPFIKPKLGRKESQQLLLLACDADQAGASLTPVFFLPDVQ